MVGTPQKSLGSSTNQVFSGAATSKTSKVAFVAPFDIYAISPIWLNWQRDTARPVFWGEMPLYIPYAIKAEIMRVRSEDGAIDTIPLSFGGKAYGVCDSQAPAPKADLLPIFIKKGERYWIRTCAFSQLVGVIPAAPTIAGSNSGGSLGNGLYRVALTYVYADGTETIPGPVSSYTVTGPTGSITVTPPASPGNGAIGYRLYISAPSSSDNVLYETINGVQPFSGATAPIITRQVLSTSAARRSTSSTLTNPQFPVSAAIAGADYSTAGGCADGSWFNGSVDLLGVGLDQIGSNTTGGGCGPIAIEGIAAPTSASVALLGDSRISGVGDDAYGLGGGFAVRALSDQTQSYRYDNTKIPLCGIVPLGSSGERAGQFATPSLSFHRRPLATQCTHLWCNYSINDLKLNINSGSATLIKNLILSLGPICSSALGLRNAGQKVKICTIPPYTNTSDGFGTVSNQTAAWDTSTNVTYAEPYRRQFNNFLLRAGGAVVTGETPMSCFTASNVTPLTPVRNIRSGGDGATKAYVTSMPFVVGSETVLVGGVATSSYTYLDNVSIGGVSYSSGIQFMNAPANGASVVMNYTEIPGAKALLSANLQASSVSIHDGSSAVEVDANGVFGVNGGWWAPNFDTQQSTACTGGSASTAVFPAASFAVDQYRGFMAVNLTSGAYGVISRNDTTTLTITGSWVAPNSGDVIRISRGFTVDGIHQSSHGHMVDAQTFDTSWIDLK
ncbi:MAG: hypothetical protein OC190_00255 [Novosphingobium aromaticivorans]|nr:hypothetical protein [Novosphingobium aromaticivorans]